MRNFYVEEMPPEWMLYAGNQCMTPRADNQRPPGNLQVTVIHCQLILESTTQISAYVQV